MTTYTTYSQVGVREDLSDEIYNIAPTDTPFFTMCKKGAPAKNRFIEWQTDTLAAAATNANVEGSDVTYNTAVPTVRLRNHTQIFDKAIIVTDTANAVTTAGRREEIGYQIAIRSAEIKRDIEFALTQNQASVLGSATTVRRLGGLESWYRSNVSRGTGGSSGGFTTSTNLTVAATDASSTNQRTFSETLLRTIIRTVWTAGGQPGVVLVGPFNKQRVSQFPGIATMFRDTQGQRSPGAVSILGAADIYVSDFGELKVVPDRFSRDRTAHILDMDYWSVHYLQPFKVTPLARTGHAEKRMIHCELTLASRNQAASGVVADLRTS